MSLLKHKKSDSNNHQVDKIVDDGADTELPKAITSSQHGGSKYRGRSFVVIAGVLLLTVLTGYLVYATVLKKDTKKPVTGNGQSTTQNDPNIQPHKLTPATAEQKAEQDKLTKSNSATQPESKAKTEVYLTAPKEANQAAPKSAVASQGPSQ